MRALRTSLATVLALAVALVAVSGCRGQRSTEPPIHLNHNMDFQQKFEAQEPSSFYLDKRAMRAPVSATTETGERQSLTVARTRVLQADDPYLRDSDHMYRGRGADGRLADALPEEVKLSAALLDRGQERYNIFCAVCHNTTGAGDGLVMRRGFPKNVWPKPYWHPDIAAMPLGYYFQVISDGRGAMGSYASQIPVADRWAIAAYVRTLQASRSAAAEELSPELRGQLDK